MTIQEFVDYWTGKKLIFSGVKNIQCMSVPHQYIYDVLNLTDATFLAQPSAYELYTNYPNYGGAQYFTRVENTPDNVPLNGDIIIWGQAVGVDGHVALFISGDVNKFTSFDENWPEGSLPHLQEHDYTGVLGWLHPQETQIAATQTVDKVQEQLKQEITAVDQCQNQLKTANEQITQLQQLAKDDQVTQQNLQLSINDLQLKYDNEQKETIALNDALAKLTNTNKDYAGQTYQSSQNVSEIEGYLDEIATGLGVNIKGLNDNSIMQACLQAIGKLQDQNNSCQKQLSTFTQIKNSVNQTINNPQAKSFFDKLASWIWVSS